MFDLPPPAIYDHVYNGPIIVQTLSADEVAKVCKNTNAMACILFFPNFPGDKCFMVLPKIGKGGVTAKTYELLLRHETAHCNGWPNNHPK